MQRMLAKCASSTRIQRMLVHGNIGVPSLGVTADWSVCALVLLILKSPSKKNFEMPVVLVPFQ